MDTFLQPTSPGLAILAVVAALALTATAVLTWDRHRGWIALRLLGLPASLVLLGLAAFVIVNRATSLFQTWSDVWGYV